MWAFLVVHGFGGGGGQGWNNQTTLVKGVGGGLVCIIANQYTGSGTIVCNGTNGNGVGASGWSYKGASGGGGGGHVYLYQKSSETFNYSIQANGGSAGSGGGHVAGAGGNGTIKKGTVVTGDFIEI